MKVFLRFMLEVFLAVVLFPLIVLIELAWLVYCIRATRYLEVPVTEGFKLWVNQIKAGLEMNKDFIVNGL